MADERYNTGDYNTGDYNTGDYNTGDYNTGDYNTGYRNTGDYNTGDYNTGYRNTGDYNTGDYNTGYRNTGDYNTGYRNTGDYNTGDYNTGDYNTGVFNSCNYSNGVFCTEEPKILIFNMQSDMTATEFYNSKWWRAMRSSTFPLTEWVDGILKENTYKEACQKWWNGLTDENKEIIKTLPNFNNEIFEEITGIKLGRKIRFYVNDDIKGYIERIIYFDLNTTDKEIEIAASIVDWLDRSVCAPIHWEEVE